MKILIADDHELLRDTLSLLFQQAGDLEADLAADVDSAVEKIATDGPYDLVLLDISMPGMNGLDGLDRVIRTEGAKRIGILTGNDSPALAEDALARGAIGFVPKTLPAKSLINAVRFMCAGETYLPANFMSRAGRDEPSNEIRDKLLPREYEVLRHLAQGMTNKEIARLLGVSEATIKVHVKAVFRKLSVQNRTQAALYARNAGVE
ncbi:LuxR family two component transcriptional regulator [Rhodovulum bhavnagarense]|uniref:LuxR family two component transcriptional regulator n=1 Tax=Rhodovulum bhavnagarense TaxID=992286 RepID=A0A4V2SVG1_9RHOB|nr:response regulator transcription factor [Rhodovulum bhavnagarense]TCP58416.1 LuxR family two component transcriptional regulator [Rhodovulum bhavnagarense]